MLKKWNPSASECLRKKLAYTHRWEHESSELKSKHLTDRPRTPELCELRAETRVVTRKKAPALSHNTCLSQVLKNIESNNLYLKIVRANLLHLHKENKSQQYVQQTFGCRALN